MEELEKTARELIFAITEKTLRSLKDKGLLKEPSKLQMLCSSPEMESLIKKLSALKCGPCRLFRKGDKVRLREYNGRAPFDNENFEKEEAGQLCIVAEDEDCENAYSLHVWKLEDMEREPDDGERPWFAFPIMFMELVTPVEEMEPYSVVEDSVSFNVVKGDYIPVFFCKGSHPHAKAAAEAECKRLNDEWRKGQE